MTSLMTTLVTGLTSSASHALTIPSPSNGVWHLGPLPVRGYALCIIAGIVAATLITERRWVARGGAPGQVLDVILWAVPLGIVGGRLYHVVSSPDAYFGEGGDPARALRITCGWTATLP